MTPAEHQMAEACGKLELALSALDTMNFGACKLWVEAANTHLKEVSKLLAEPPPLTDDELEALEHDEQIAKDLEEERAEAAHQQKQAPWK